MTSINRIDNSPIRVMFFGDSICVGQGVSIYRGWVTQVAKYLDEYGKSIGKDILVTNASINGRTSRQALEDMPYSVQSQDVDILVIQFGMNDCNYWKTDNGLPRVSLGAFSENIKEMVNRGINSGVFRVLLNNNHPTMLTTEMLPMTTNTYENSNSDYNDEIEKLSESFGEEVLFQNVNSYFKNMMNSSKKPLSDYLLSDGLHLSDAGHNAYFDLMKPAMHLIINHFISHR